MKMMSLSQFRTNLFKCFELMKDANASFTIYHRRKVYRIHVEETGEKVTVPYKNKGRKAVVPSAFIETGNCPHCDSLLINSICMNKSCPAA